MVDYWRLKWPIGQLRKHTDWTIDERPTLIPDLEGYKSPKEFTEKELQRAYDDVCSYDIVWSAYQANPSMYTLLQVANKHHGTQYVMDVDDDMFAINPDNPVWFKLTDENVYHMQRMIAHNGHITTTTDTLAGRFRERRGLPADTVSVIPNYIPDHYKQYDPDNGDSVVIGFFGGSSHYADLHETGVLPALREIMHKYKHVRAKFVGMIVDEYLPKGRTTVLGGKKGDPWVNEVWPSLNFDIALGPLVDNLFNQGKSNIKWQESTRMGAAFVASNVGPYADLTTGTATLVPNDEKAWYGALELLVTSAVARQELVRQARRELQANWRMEDHWQAYQRLFERIHAGKSQVVVA